MKKWSLRGVILVFALAIFPPIAHAAGVSGSTCKKEGAMENVAGTKYRCSKTIKGLNWVKTGAVKVATPTPSAAPSKLNQSILVKQVKGTDITSGKITGVFSTNSNLPIVLQTSTPENCSVQDTWIQLLQTGTCSVQANQSGNDKYLPAQQVSLNFEIIDPVISSDNSLFDEVNIFIRIPLGSTFSSDTAKIALTGFTNDATAKVCANDRTASGCITSNGAGVADPTSDSRYVQFDFHVTNLDTSPLPPISYRLLAGGVLTDIDSGVTLDTLNSIVVDTNASADASLYGIVPKDMKLDGAYLVIDEGISSRDTRVLLSLSK